MNVSNDSGAVRGYTPAPQAQQYPQQYQPQGQMQIFVAGRPAQQCQQHPFPLQQSRWKLDPDADAELWQNETEWMKSNPTLNGNQHQPPQQYPPQPFQTGQCQQPLQQYQQAQPVQPPQQYYQQAANAVVYERYATAEQITEKQPVQRKSGGLADFFKRRDVLLLIAAIICTVWLLISYNTIGGLLEANQPGETAEELGAAVGTAIGAAMTIPFFILAFIGQVFNWLGWIFNRRGFALTAGILYCVSLVFGFSYGLGIIPCIVLAFIGYARLKKKQK